MKAHSKKEKAKVSKQHDMHAEHAKQAHDQHDEAQHDQDVRLDQQHQNAMAELRSAEAIRHNLPQAVGARRSDRPGGRH